jgi:hypothetical protein
VRTVLRTAHIWRATSLIDKPTDRDSRRISAQFSTLNTSSSPVRSRTRVDGFTPQAVDPRKGVRIRPSIRGHYSGVVDTVEVFTYID